MIKKGYVCNTDTNTIIITKSGDGNVEGDNDHSSDGDDKHS